MRLIVHVGPGKTGTTAIQTSLLNGADALRAKGVLYLGLMFERSPVKLHPWQRPGGFDTFHKLPAAQAKNELDTLLRRTLSVAAEAGIDTLVISNESLLRREAVFVDVLEQLRREGVSLMIVAYARRYDALARSAYIQWGLNHKTYTGPLKDFRQWMRGRELSLSPSILRWQAKLGADFLLRNFDTCGDVVTDFLQATGLDGAGVKPVRVYETPSANEIALRALFNEQHPGTVASARFTRLFASNKLSFARPLDTWLDGLLPAEEALVELDASLASERDSINRLLGDAGQPPLDESMAKTVPFQVDTEAMLGTLFQMIAQQALKIEVLELAIAEGLQPVSTRAPEPAPHPPVNPDISRALAPALGYFGSHASDQLQLAVTGKVKEIRLCLRENKPTFLNLRGLELRHRGKPLNPDSRGGTATQSSISGNDPRNGPDCLLAQTGIHTAAETQPWWRMVFDAPVVVDELRLSNRSDGWGSRSRTLAIDIVDQNGHCVRLHDGQSEPALARVLAATSTAAAIEVAALPATAEAAVALRSRLLSTMAERLLSGDLALAGVAWRDVVPMLDVWGTAEPQPAEWTVMAGFLLSQQQGKGGTSIKSFSLLLDSTPRLSRLQREINRLAQSIGLDSYMLTRHGVKRQGILRREPQRFIAHMEAVLAALQRMGREPVLAYGTLLGAVREGNFIVHDDDIDLLYRCRAGSRAEVEAQLPAIKEALRVEGFKVVDLLPNSLNMHVIDARTGAVMDVFPCWEQDACVQLHMEGMKVRGIDPAIVYPVGQVTFLDRTLPAPAQPEAFLEERYGPGWRISDQFFEWPWALKAPVAEAPDFADTGIEETRNEKPGIEETAR